MKKKEYDKALFFGIIFLILSVFFFSIATINSKENFRCIKETFGCNMWLIWVNIIPVFLCFVSVTFTALIPITILFGED